MVLNGKVGYMCNRLGVGLMCVMDKFSLDNYPVLHRLPSGV